MSSNNGVDSYPVIHNLLVAIATVLVVVLFRIIIRRVVGTLVEKGFLSLRGLETITRIIDITSFTVAVLIIILLFSPQFWIVLVLLGVLALTLYVVLFDVIKPYVAGLAIQLSPIFRSKSLDIILPEYNSAITGKLARVDAQYLVIQDVFGNEYYIRNDTVLDSIIRITPVYVRLVVEIVYKCFTQNLAEKISELIEALEKTRIMPLFKDEVKVNLLEVSSRKVILELKLYPTRLPVRQAELFKAINAIIEAVKACSSEDCSIEDITVKIPAGT
jgi:hypothetical protein